MNGLSRALRARIESPCFKLNPSLFNHQDRIPTNQPLKHEKNMNKDSTQSAAKLELCFPKIRSTMHLTNSLSYVLLKYILRNFLGNEDYMSI